MNARNASARKYQWMTVGMVALFLYLSATEIVDRWGETFQIYGELQAKELQSPENLVARKLELQARQHALAARFIKDAGRFEQSETGVVEFLNAAGRETGVTFESLTPVAADRAGRMQEVSFSIRAVADFHGIGRFINQLETGPMMVRMKSLDLSAAQKTSSRISARIEGSAFVIPGR